MRPEKNQRTHSEYLLSKIMAKTSAAWSGIKRRVESLMALQKDEGRRTREAVLTGDSRQAWQLCRGLSHPLSIAEHLKLMTYAQEAEIGGTNSNRFKRISIKGCQICQGQCQYLLVMHGKYRNSFKSNHRIQVEQHGVCSIFHISTVAKFLIKKPTARRRVFLLLRFYLNTNRLAVFFIYGHNC